MESENNPIYIHSDRSKNVPNHSAVFDQLSSLSQQRKGNQNTVTASDRRPKTEKCPKIMR